MRGERTERAAEREVLSGKEACLVGADKADFRTTSAERTERAAGCPQVFCTGSGGWTPKAMTASRGNVTINKGTFPGSNAIPKRLSVYLPFERCSAFGRMPTK